ncbi:hypothetical protein PLEOSDRAFT_162883 [Pleurotus ostreatus PC15]|uniref:Uncharacterized protein n=1 Tax=Pleurotus ostreatus (strain PC15) TaxID=1137138 RepID=A0A067NG47_PLEO1|nr:hypothetical protein PLEOSDRAFT_162883 [Pleurotus ostreatus PC15]
MHDFVNRLIEESAMNWGDDSTVTMTNCGMKNVNNTNCFFSESNDTVEHNRGDTYYSPRGPITTHTAPNGNQNFNSGSGTFNTARSQTSAAPNGQPEREGSPIPYWDPRGQVQTQPSPWSRHEATAQQGPFERRGKIRLENCGWKNVGNTNSTFVESNDRTAYTSGDYYNNPQDPINTYRTPGGTQNINNGNGIFNNIAGSQTFVPTADQQVSGYPNPWQNQHPRAVPAMEAVINNLGDRSRAANTTRTRPLGRPVIIPVILTMRRCMGPPIRWLVQWVQAPSYKTKARNTYPLLVWMSAPTSESKAPWRRDRKAAENWQSHDTSSLDFD